MCVLGWLPRNTPINSRTKVIAPKMCSEIFAHISAFVPREEGVRSKEREAGLGSATKASLDDMQVLKHHPGLYSVK
jgi:hypothetical protein